MSQRASFQVEQYLLALGERMNIWQAAARGDIGELTAFLDKGADINVTDGNLDRTPLCCALLYDHTETAIFLIEKGAALNTQDLLGYTPLHMAVVQSNTRMVALLLEKGADVTIEDLSDQPENALAKAYKYGDKAIVELLKQAYANRCCSGSFINPASDQ